MPSRVVIETPKSPASIDSDDNLYSPAIPEVETFVFKPPSALKHGAAGGGIARRNSSPGANSGSSSSGTQQQTKKVVSITPPQASIPIGSSSHPSNSMASPTLHMVPSSGGVVVGVLKTNTTPAGSNETSSGVSHPSGGAAHPQQHPTSFGFLPPQGNNNGVHQPPPINHTHSTKGVTSPSKEARKSTTGSFSPPSHSLNHHSGIAGKSGSILKRRSLANSNANFAGSGSVSEVELVSVNTSGIQEKTRSSVSGGENDSTHNVGSDSDGGGEVFLVDPRIFSPRKSVKIDTSVSSSDLARDTSATKFGRSSSNLKKKKKIDDDDDEDDDDVAYIDAAFSIPAGNVHSNPASPLRAQSVVSLGSDGSGEEGSAFSPKMRAGVSSKLSYPALPLKRKPMMANRVPPYNFLVRPEYDSLVKGLTSLIFCRKMNVDPDFTKVNALNESDALVFNIGTRGGGDTEEKTRAIMRTSVSEMDDDEEDDDYVPVFFAPIWLMNVFVLVVIGMSVLVFAFPGLLDMSMLWSSGELHAVDSLLPIVVYLMAAAARAFSNSHGLLLDRTNKHHLIHPVFQESLSSYFVDLERHKVKSMATSKKKGLLVRRKTVKALHASLKNPQEQAPVRGHRASVVEGSAPAGGTVFRAALYADMISSNASLTATQETRSTTGLFSFGVPVLVGVSPIIGRIVDGGSLWASGSIPELALVVFGSLLTIIAAHTLTNMINLHLETLNYHGIMTHRITAALPVQSTAHHDDHLAKFFPKIPFNSIGNVMAWHRMRWVLGEAPHPLVHFGSLVFEGIAMVATIFIAFSIISDYSQGGGKFTGAASGVATMLVFLLPTVTIGLLRLPLHINHLLSSHVSMLSQIILESLGHDSSTAQAKASKQSKKGGGSVGTSHNNTPRHYEMNPLAGPTSDEGRTNDIGLMAGEGGTNFVANSAFLAPDNSNAMFGSPHSHQSGGSRASFASTSSRSSIVSEDEEQALQQHLKLRKVVRDIASALPHHTKLYTFLGFQVSPGLLFVLAIVYILFAVASVDLLVRRFSD